MSYLEGLDLSNNNGDVDIAKEKEARGLSFIIHKATEGVAFTDFLYEQRREQCAQLGLVYGCYHFFHPEQDTQEQVSHFLSVAKPQPGDIVALDLEITGKQSWQHIANAAATFLDSCEERVGHRVWLYSYDSFLKELPTANLVTHPLWVAQPGSEVNGQLAPTYLDRWHTWTCHQYGQSGGLDQNHFNGDLAELEASLGRATPPVTGGSRWYVMYLPAGTPTPAPWSKVVTETVLAPDAATAETMVPPGATFVDIHPAP